MDSSNFFSLALTKAFDRGGHRSRRIVQSSSGRRWNMRFRLSKPEARQICPYCAAPAQGGKQCVIDWDDEKRAFRVQFAFTCGHHYFDHETVKLIPVIIAANSHCSCGSTLNISNYTIRTVTGGEVEFEGLYVCPACTAKKRCLVSQLKHLISEFWKSTSKIEVGLTGIKYEKKSS